ncbi:hypothetical protein [Evansella clarkii]|uniref:hypothetical protein n=1 Tax=Evansella clarkii TaxID=79879 RepID=UPI0014309962|nr:hypothetical protein [Evansella clarkii]
MITNYSVMIQNEVRRGQEKYDVNDLFKNPLIHREISGEKVYIPLDTKRLWQK